MLVLAMQFSRVEAGSAADERIPAGGCASRPSCRRRRRPGHGRSLKAEQKTDVLELESSGRSTSGQLGSGLRELKT
jgi:hypothetical protein